MRVIGGKFRRRTLRTLPGLELRPTSDRLRETLFDILGPSVSSAHWLDIFAGSGAVGIEALSRGAINAVFIEKHRAAVAVIRENLGALGASSAGTVIAASAEVGLKQLSDQGYTADYIFLDPPYALAAQYEATLRFLDESTVLAPEGVVIAEHARRNPLPERLVHLVRARIVKQGDAALSFYRRGDGP
jgi:16S rRNA (guanine966-N2)-methyltransferase